MVYDSFRNHMCLHPSLSQQCSLRLKRELFPLQKPTREETVDVTPLEVKNLLNKFVTFMHVLVVPMLKLLS